MLPLKDDFRKKLRAQLARIGADHEFRWIEEHLSQKHGPGDDPDRLHERFGDIVERRLKGEPLAYIFESWAFRHHEFAVGPGVLIPRPETEELVDHALLTVEKILHESKVQKLKIADLGAGSGCLGLSLALELEELFKRTSREDLLLEVDLVERSVEAWPWLLKNYKALKNRLKEPQNVKLLHEDWLRFSQRQAPKSFQLIVSNPPYVSLEEFEKLDLGVKGYEPKQALVPQRSGAPKEGAGDCLEAYRELMALCERLLVPGGYFLLEYGNAQQKYFSDLVNDHTESWIAELEILRDMAGKDRFLKARRKC